MALDCQDTGNSALEQFVSNSVDGIEKVESFHPASHIHPTAYCSGTTKQALNQCNTLKPTFQFSPRRGGAKVEDSGSNGSRSIADLPTTLVSEILHCLDPKDLAVVSCVSTFLNGLATDNHGWKDFYCKLWGPPASSATPLGSWKELFVERERRSKSFMGRFSIETLRGHTEAVRSVFLLQSAKLIFTGGYDSVIRIWDMEEGLLVAESEPLGCTIRAIAADTEILAVAGTDAFIQCWSVVEGNPCLFDITGSISDQNPELRLWGHGGPITCLALDSSRLFSGSWDMSIRVWDRVHMKCLKILRHGDWVWSLAPCGSTISSTAGSDAYIWDIDVGNLVTFIDKPHVGNATSLTRSHAGDLLFTGGEDGSIHMFQIENCHEHANVKPCTTWTPHTGPVHSLVFEFPWLVSSSADGRIALINVRKLLGSNLRSVSRHRSVFKQSVGGSMEPPQRMLHGFGNNLYSVTIGMDRIICGGEEGVVRVWDFSEALEIENRVRALRGIRLENRMRRRKVQIELNGKGRCADQSSSAVKRNPTNGYRNCIWHSKTRERKT